MGDKSKKVGRQIKSPQNIRYKAERRHEKSHIRRIKKHIDRYCAGFGVTAVQAASRGDQEGMDVSAYAALEKHKIAAGVR